ncbi:MAG: CRTAC1 family protein [Myxococcota bacterium]
MLPWLAACDPEPPPPAPDLSVERVRAFAACADPGARESLGPWERVELGGGWVFDPAYHTASWNLRFGARGLVVADLDGDGHLDLVAPQVHEPTRLLWGDGRGGFTPGALPDLPELRGPTGGSAADWDGDGDLDLFLYGQGKTPDTQGMPPGTPVMLENDGGGGFTATAHPEWDDPTLGGCGGSASFGDWDGDGDLDLLYGRLGMTLPSDQSYFCGTKLLQNDGGSWTDVSDRLPAPAKEIRVLASGFLPFDDDPEPELYLVADAVMEEIGITSGSNLLLDRVGDAYVAAEGTGLELVLAGMGLAAGDPNGDGRIDVMVPGVDELGVMMSVSPSTRAWVDSSIVTGIAPGPEQHSGWGGEWDDLDLDGWTDLALTYGAFADPQAEEPDEIYRGAPDGTFTPVGAAWGFADRFPSRGFVVADLDEDGWPDLVKRELGGIVVTYLSRCGSAQGLQVSLSAGGPNPDAIGATVRARIGGRTQLRYVTAGSTSYQTGGPPIVSFGLGDSERVDDLEVTWPDGTVGSTGPVDAGAWVRVR